MRAHARPCGTNHFPAALRHNPEVVIPAETVDIYKYFGQIYYLAGRRLHPFGHENRMVEKILQKRIVTTFYGANFR